MRARQCSLTNKSYIHQKLPKVAPPLIDPQRCPSQRPCPPRRPLWRSPCRCTPCAVCRGHSAYPPTYPHLRRLPADSHPLHTFPHPRRRLTAPIPPDGAARPAPDLPRRSPTAPPSEIAAFRRASSPRSTTIPPTPLPPSPPPTFPPSEQRHPDRSGATFPAHDTPHLSTSHADTRIVMLYSVCVSGAMQFSRG